MTTTFNNREQAFGILAEVVASVVGKDGSAAFRNLLKAKPTQLPRLVDVAKARFRSFSPNIRERIRVEIDRRFGRQEILISPDSATKTKSGDTLEALAANGREITLDDLLNAA